MTLLSPSLARLEAPLVETLQLMDDLGCESVHIDACHNLTLPNFFELEEVRTAQIGNYRAAATVHIFQPISNTPPILDFLRPIDLAVLHVFGRTAVSAVHSFLETNRVVGCRLGLAVDVKANTESIAPFLAELDTVFIMAIQVGGYGLEPDTHLLKRVEQTRTLLTNHNPRCRIGIDGGVNGRTFSGMVRLADELVIGSLLLHADDLVAQWMSLHEIAKGGKEK